MSLDIISMEVLTSSESFLFSFLIGFSLFFEIFFWPVLLCNLQFFINFYFDHIWNH